MCSAEELNIIIAHITFDKNKLRSTNIKLHNGHSKTLWLVQTSAVGTIIAADAICISGDATKSAMSHEACRVTAISVEFAPHIHVDPAKCLSLKEERRGKLEEASQRKRNRETEMVAALNAPTREESISACV